MYLHSPQITHMQRYLQVCSWHSWTQGQDWKVYNSTLCLSIITPVAASERKVQTLSKRWFNGLIYILETCWVLNVLTLNTVMLCWQDNKKCWSVTATLLTCAPALRALQNLFLTAGLEHFWDFTVSCKQSCLVATLLTLNLLHFQLANQFVLAAGSSSQVKHTVWRFEQRPARPHFTGNLYSIILF